MNKVILHTEVQQFINDNLHTDIASLLLKKPLFANVTNQEIAAQIEAKRRSEKKLPTWFTTANIYFPNKLNIEQTSSEVTAAYKAGLVSGTSFVDVTGGFGIDVFYFSKHFKNVTHCELNTELSAIAASNAAELGVANVQFKATDGIAYLAENNLQYNCIYIDPSRRNDAKGKVFMLSDCLPNVPENLTMLFSKAEQILIKTSPVLDISVGLQELTGVVAIHIVAVNNEVKELLWLLQKGYEGAVTMKTINLDTKQPEFTFELEAENIASCSFSEPLTYLYEPNAAILKAGAFKIIAGQYNLQKLHQHSHLYTSNELVNFPGRSFKVLAVLPYQKKLLKDTFKNYKANITTRNFPDKPEVFRKQFKIKDGGNKYLFLTTDITNKKIVIITEKAEPHGKN